MMILLVSCQTSNRTTSTRHRPTATKPAPVKHSFLVQFEHHDLLSKSMEKSKETGKPIFIDFYTSWCAPCRLMDDEVFNNRQTADYLNKNFVNLKVNAEKGNGPTLAMLYKVRSYPTLIFLDGNGKVLERKDGAAFYSELTIMGNKALNKANSRP